MNFVNYASANRRERLNPPERLIRSERLIAKQKNYHYLFKIYKIFFKSDVTGDNFVTMLDHHIMTRFLCLVFILK